jgi:osmotically-inducible protein OsmY
MNEAGIVNSLMAALEREPRIDLRRDRIECRLYDGIATLSGEVSDIAAKRVALEVTARLPTVKGIVDHLYTRPAEQMGDGMIADHVEHALLGDSSFDECSIYRHDGGGRTIVRDASQERRTGWVELGVEGGVVTLDGDVPSLSHKRLAGALAWWVPGSRDVVNGLGVEPNEDDNDDEILDALRLILEKDPLVDATQIRTSCTNAVVTLHGLVTSDAQRHIAEFDAWAVFGVDQVHNEIDVRQT